MQEQTSFSFDNQYVERASIPSGPEISTGGLHYCNEADYHACVSNKVVKKAETVTSWCGATLKGNQVYPKMWKLVSCEECRKRREQLRANWSEEIWRRHDPGEVYEEEDENQGEE